PLVNLGSNEYPLHPEQSIYPWNTSITFIFNLEILQVIMAIPNFLSSNKNKVAVVQATPTTEKSTDKTAIGSSKNEQPAQKNGSKGPSDFKVSAMAYAASRS
ncbi:hypothetical protein BGW38_011007, partial [Lunasporangiospora selenospora]